MTTTVLRLNPPAPPPRLPDFGRSGLLWLLPIVLCVVALVLGFVHLGCASSPPPSEQGIERAADVGMRAVELGAGECVIVARQKHDGATEAICVRVEEIAREADAILADRLASTAAADGGAR